MRNYRHILFLLITFWCIRASATHNRAGEITYKWLFGYTYEIKVTTYTNIGGSNIADRCEVTLYFGDGGSAVVQRSNGPGTLCGSAAHDGVAISPTIKLNEYITTHTYVGPGTYIMSMTDPNRNGGIVNIPNSINQVFYIESRLLISPFMASNNSPVLTFPPIDNGCTNQCFLHNPGAYDTDGDSLSYEITYCRGAGGVICPGYSYPAASNSYSIDPIMGTLTWCSPGYQGEYNLAMIIKEWRLNSDGDPILVGSVIRDLQVDVGACTNDPPHITINNPDTFVIAGDPIMKSISATDLNADVINLTANGGTFHTVTPAASVFTALQSASPASGIYSWNTSYANMRKAPYQVTLKAEDQNAQLKLVDFKAFRIKIIPHSPRNLIATGASNFIRLNWDKPLYYSLGGANPFRRYMIYRKTGFSSWTHSNTETVPPSSTGYTLIGYTNNSISDTLFFDFNGGNSFPTNQTYSYLVLAEYTDGSMSYVSNTASNQIFVETEEQALITSGITVFPNPTAETCNISFNNIMDGVYNVSLFDVNGRKIKTFMDHESIKSTISLNIETIPTGIYYIYITIGDQIITKKIIKH